MRYYGFRSGKQHKQPIMVSVDKLSVCVQKIGYSSMANEYDAYDGETGRV